MRTSEIRQRSDEELETLAGQLEEDLFRLRVQKATNQLEDTATLTRVRKDIARVHTIRRGRAKGIEEANRSES